MSNPKFKAAVLKTLREPVELQELEIPPLECGQVLVRVHFSGICGAQIGEIAGVKGEDKYLPHLLGHEGGGIVEDIGPGITQVRKGDHVTMHWRKGAGINSLPPKYKSDTGQVGGGWVTTFNEYSVVSENRLTRIDPEIPLEVAALLGCAVTTGLGVVNNDAQLKIGQSIAVLGCGGVGLNVVQGAALVAGYPIIAIDLHKHKLEQATRFGATHTIDSSNSGIRDEIKRIVGNSGMDVVVDTTGSPQLIEAAYDSTATSGRTILIGQVRHDLKVSLQTLPLHAGRLIIGSDGGQTDPNRDIPRYLNLYRGGRLRLAELITDRFSLREINVALEHVRAGQAGRCMISM